ncbi:MAG: fumarylacetoacetate hydrolase family protein [Chloroflexota bacterium]
MPICRFQLHATESRMTRLGWLDLEQERVYELSETIGNLLSMSAEERIQRLAALRRSAVAAYPLSTLVLRAPVDDQEIWAAGVTYEQSRDARMEESGHDDLYLQVYNADRPELFMKASGWRCVGHGQAVGIRADSSWDVPEPELTLVVDSAGEIAGYTIGNDVSSRSIEGENALYLPQAKMYYASCALGPWIMLSEELPEARNLPISMTITRDEEPIWTGKTNTNRLRRSYEELIDHLFRGLDFPSGVFLMTGTGLVPPPEYTLETGDEITIDIEGIGTLRNRAIRLEAR